MKNEPNINSALSWLGQILEYITKYGILNILKAILTIVILTITLQLRFSPEVIVDTYKTSWEDKHEQAQIERIKNEDAINDMLPDIARCQKSDRVFIIQYHNGTADWSYGSMKFEECSYNSDPIKDEFRNFPLSLVPLSTYLRNNECFAGDIEELKKIDPGVARIYEEYNINYCVFVLLKKSRKELGMIGLTYTKMPENFNMNMLLKYTGKIEELL